MSDREEIARIVRTYWPESGGQTMHSMARRVQETCVNEIMTVLEDRQRELQELISRYRQPLTPAEKESLIDAICEPNHKRVFFVLEAAQQILYGRLVQDDGQIYPGGSKPGDVPS